MRSTPSPLTLSLSKGEPLMVRQAHHERRITSLRALVLRSPKGMGEFPSSPLTLSVEGRAAWFDKLTTSGGFPTELAGD